MGDVFVEGGKKDRKGKEKEKGKGVEGKKEKKRKERKGNRYVLSSPAFRWLGLIKPRSKVRLRDEGYAPRGKDSSYFCLFSTIRSCFFKIWECCPVLILRIGRILAPVFHWEIESIWTRVLYRNCSFICELDVRLLNHPNWTSTMVHFPGLLQLRLFIDLCPDFGTRFQCRFCTDFRTNLSLYHD